MTFAPTSPKQLTQLPGLRNVSAQMIENLCGVLRFEDHKSPMSRAVFENLLSTVTKDIISKFQEQMRYQSLMFEKSLDLLNNKIKRIASGESVTDFQETLGTVGKARETTGVSVVVDQDKISNVTPSEQADCEDNISDVPPSEQASMSGSIEHMNATIETLCSRFGIAQKGMRAETSVGYISQSICTESFSQSPSNVRSVRNTGNLSNPSGSPGRFQRSPARDRSVSPVGISQSTSLDRGASPERVSLPPLLDKSASPGRFSRSPSQDRSGRNTDNRCFHCEEGHFSRDCIKERRPRSPSPFMRTPMTPLN